MAIEAELGETQPRITKKTLETYVKNELKGVKKNKVAAIARNLEAKAVHDITGLVIPEKMTLAGLIKILGDIEYTVSEECAIVELIDETRGNVVYPYGLDEAGREEHLRELATMHHAMDVEAEQVKTSLFILGGGV